MNKPLGVSREIHPVNIQGCSAISEFVAFSSQFLRWGPQFLETGEVDMSCQFFLFLLNIKKLQGNAHCVRFLLPKNSQSSHLDPTLPPKIVSKCGKFLPKNVFPPSNPPAAIPSTVTSCPRSGDARVDAPERSKGFKSPERCSIQQKTASFDPFLECTKRIFGY